MDVLDRRCSDEPVLADGPTDDELDVVACALVVVDVLATRGCDLHEHRVADGQLALREQFAERREPYVDALRVVEAVDTEQHVAGIAQRRSDLGRGIDRLGSASDRVVLRGVDRDGERTDDAPPDPGVGEHVRHLDRIALESEAEQAHCGLEEVGGVPFGLHPDQIRAEETGEHLVAPRQLAEQLRGREGDVVEEADGEVGSSLAQQLRNELQLIVVHPHGGIRRREGSDAFGEAPIDLAVGLPVVSMKGRRRDAVVVERPECAVAEALVEAVDLVLGELDLVERARTDSVGHWLEREPVVVRGIRVGRVAPGPADPDGVDPAQGRLQSAHEAAGRARPRRGAAVVCAGLHGQAIRDDDELMGRIGSAHSRR